MDIMVTEGTLEDDRTVDKKIKGDVYMVDVGNKKKEVVLEDQHHRSQ